MCSHVNGEVNVIAGVIKSAFGLLTILSFQNPLTYESSKGKLNIRVGGMNSAPVRGASKSPEKHMNTRKAEGGKGNRNKPIRAGTCTAEMSQT